MAGRVALVIGNGAYSHAMTLDNAANDAEAMALLLNRLDFEVVKGINLDQRAMGDVQATFETALRAKPDVALLFYAGHGLQVRGKNYLIPIDAEITEMAHLASRALLFNDVLEPMSEEAGASLIFLDACRDSPFTRNLARTLGEVARSQDVRGGLARVDKVAGTFIAYATAPDRVAFDGKGKNSPFTGALLKHIETPGLSVGDMMIDVRNSVLEETGGRQEPWDQSSLRSRFYFVAAAPQLPTIPNKMLEAAAEWSAIRETESLATLAIFRGRFPEPPWSTYADIRVAELREMDEVRRKSADEVIELGKTDAEAKEPWSSRVQTFLSIEAHLSNSDLESINPEQEEATLGTDSAHWQEAEQVIDDATSDPRQSDESRRKDAEVEQVEVGVQYGATTEPSQMLPPRIYAVAEPEAKLIAPSIEPAPIYPSNFILGLFSVALLVAGGLGYSNRLSLGPSGKGGRPTVVLADKAPARTIPVDATTEPATPAKLPVVATITAPDVMASPRKVATVVVNPGEPISVPDIPKDPADLALMDGLMGDISDQDGGFMVSVGAGKKVLKPGDTFRDYAGGPEMVIVPSGIFTMGSNNGDDDEKPLHLVTVGHAFAVGKFEVTFEEWDACVFDGNCKHQPDDSKWGRGKQPVINVSWDDVTKEYLPWLSHKTGKTYRLLSEAEWEYAARAGSKTTYDWGNDIGENRANCEGCGSRWDNSQPITVGSFRPSAFGIYDMHGNVWEWVQDCESEGYKGASGDGSPPKDPTTVCRHVLRGGSFDDSPWDLRGANRFRGTNDRRSIGTGFRLCRTLSGT